MTVGGTAWDVARLAAQIAVEDGEVGGELRRVSREAVDLARRLEGVLGRLAVLEARFERTVRKTEARTGQEIDEEVFAQLVDTSTAGWCDGPESATNAPRVELWASTTRTVQSPGSDGWILALTGKRPAR